MPVGLHFDPASLSNELLPAILNNWSMIDNKAQSPETLFRYHWGCRSAHGAAKGVRYEDTCLDRRTACGGLAGRRAATATTGAWCRRPDKQFDPSKQYMYRRNGCDFLQPTHRPEPRGLRIKHCYSRQLTLNEGRVSTTCSGSRAAWGSPRRRRRPRPEH
jgi:hypothetical protein